MTTPIISLNALEGFPSGEYTDGDLRTHDCFVVMESPLPRFFYCVRKSDKKLLHVHEAHLKIESKSSPVLKKNET